MVQTKIFIVF